MPFSFGSDSINEGEIAQLICFVSKGDEPLTISWYLKGDTLSSDPSISTTMIGTRTSMLMINNVGYRHSGTYSCRATNHADSVSQTAELKVNGNSRVRQEVQKKDSQDFLILEANDVLCMIFRTTCNHAVFFWH